MNFRKTLYVLLAINLFAFSLIAQNTPHTVLADEFGRIIEEDLMARLDSFIVQLQNDPNSRGYIHSWGVKQTLDRNERRIKSYLRTRRFPANQFTFVRGEGFETEYVNGGPSDPPRFKFWLVPAGSDPPDMD